jgi:hypothetical protein
MPFSKFRKNQEEVNCEENSSTITMCNKLYPADILNDSPVKQEGQALILGQREVMLYNGLSGPQHVIYNAQQQLYGYIIVACKCNNHAYLKISHNHAL